MIVDGVKIETKPYPADEHPPSQPSRDLLDFLHSEVTHQGRLALKWRPYSKRWVLIRAKQFRHDIVLMVLENADGSYMHPDISHIKWWLNIQRIRAMENAKSIFAAWESKKEKQKASDDRKDAGETADMQKEFDDLKQIQWGYHDSPKPLKTGPKRFGARIS